MSRKSSVPAVAPAAQPRYRAWLPELQLGIFQGSHKDHPEVPADGRFHVTFQGNLIASYKYLAPAQACYNELRKLHGVTRKQLQPLSDAEQVHRDINVGVAARSWAQ